MDFLNGAPVAKDYCNTLALAQGFDPGGHAGSFADAVLIETPLPWKRSMYESAGALPQEMIDLLALWLERYRAGQPYNHRPLLLAPDPEYAFPGHRRVIYFARPGDAMAAFERREYLVPDAAVGPLVWALFEDRERLGQFAQHRIPIAATTRDLLVCTHGSVDVACAKFGFPLYQHLRDTYAGGTSETDPARRVWRVSHFGGHIFAPTLMDFPTGHYWAYVGQEQAARIVARDADPAPLCGHLRGWAGVPGGFAQVADREVWQRVGWTWFDYTRSAAILAQDVEHEEPHWAEVAVDYTTLAGDRGRYLARVEVERWIETHPSSGDSKTYTYPQYKVTTVTHADVAAGDPIMAGAVAAAG